MKKLILLLVTSFVSPAFAGEAEHIAKLVRFSGDVKVLTDPAAAVMGAGPHVLVDGTYYTVAKPKFGMTLPKDSVVQTGAKAKAKFVYDNGDQVSVGESTAYKIKWGLAKSKDKSVLDLLFGKVRLMIMKGGPRTGMEVRTRSATMGVRGTDFYVASYSENGGSQIVVLRGEVEVTPATEGAKPVQVPAGYAAKVPTTTPALTDKKPDAKAASPAITLKPATKKELVQVQEESRIEQPTPAEELAPEVSKELKELEERAIAATLTDIKKTDPALYDEISKDPQMQKSSDNLSTVAVKKVFEQTTKSKASESSLESSDDVYEKYFKLK